MLSDVIVVSFNSALDIRACVNSILANGANPIVVDNGSTDATLHILATEFPQVRILRNLDNGYSRAANVGFANTDGDVVILSNADVIYPTNSITRVSDYLRSHRRVGVLGPQQVCPDGSWQRSWGMETGIAEALCELLGIATLYSIVRRAFWPVRMNRRVLNVGYVDGAIMVIRRSVFEAIGGFDERFWFSSEDTDFCVRVRRAGWRVIALPTVDVVHRRGGSSNRLNWSLHRHTSTLLEGTRIFLQKYRGSRYAKCYFAIKRLSHWNLMVLCEAASRLAPGSLRLPVEEKARIHRSYVDHLRPVGSRLPASSSS